MILIITNTEDLTSDFVVREISQRGLNFARLNTDEFPRNGLGTVRFEDSSSFLSLMFNGRKDHIDFNTVRSILYRRPILPVPVPEIQHEGLRKFCVDESYDFLRGLWFSAESFWMSHPESIRVAEHKIYQLKIAQSLGFKIPPTLITNNPNELIKFYAQHMGNVVIKPLYLGFIDDKLDPKLIYTTQISEEDMKDVNSLAYAPSIFQKRIHKDFDIRVTVVGEKLFCAKIEASGLPINIPDWRFSDDCKLMHSQYSLPVEVERKCIDLVRKLNLEFGAIDLAVDERGEYIFFEINPNGQWAWLEIELGFPICATIVDRLARE